MKIRVSLSATQGRKPKAGSARQVAMRKEPESPIRQHLANLSFGQKKFDEGLTEKQLVKLLKDLECSSDETATILQGYRSKSK